jgi:hypothetical protein
LSGLWKSPSCPASSASPKDQRAQLFAYEQKGPLADFAARVPGLSTRPGAYLNTSRTEIVKLITGKNLDARLKALIEFGPWPVLALLCAPFFVAGPGAAKKILG